MQTGLHRAGNAGGPGKQVNLMPRFSPLRLFRRRKQLRPEPHPALDRSRLLEELEVNVPAPQRIVCWEDAAGSRLDPQRLTRT